MKNFSRVALIAGAALALSAPAASAQTREYEGTVVSINRAERTFKLRDSERGTIRVRVTNRTRFERISGFSGLKVGATNIETDRPSLQRALGGGRGRALRWRRQPWRVR